MKFLSQMLLILFPIPCPAILGYKLDLLIGLSLRKGGILPKQSGDYLMDSFRVNSLIPAFAQIEEKLRNLNSSDHWTLAGNDCSECLHCSGKPTSDLEDKEIGKEAI